MKIQIRKHKFFSLGILVLISLNSIKTKGMKDDINQEKIYYPSPLFQEENCYPETIKLNSKNGKKDSLNYKKSFKNSKKFISYTKSLPTKFITPFGSCSPKVPTLEFNKLENANKLDNAPSKSEKESMLKIYGFNKYTGTELKKTLMSPEGFEKKMQQILMYIIKNKLKTKNFPTQKLLNFIFSVEKNLPKFKKKDKNKKIIFSKILQDLNIIGAIFKYAYINENLNLKKFRKNILYALGFFCHADQKYNLIKSKKIFLKFFRKSKPTEDIKNYMDYSIRYISKASKIIKDLGQPIRNSISPLSPFAKLQIKQKKLR